MVATRRSLGGEQAAPASSAANLSKKQRADLKKLEIAGTDALKGDKKAKEAANENVETYHFRGAAYVRDKFTKQEWLDKQPQRYTNKRSRESTAASEEVAEDITKPRDNNTGEEEERNTEAPPAKRRRTEPTEPTSRPTKLTTISPPTKRKAAELGDDDRPMPAPKRRASAMNSTEPTTMRQASEPKRKSMDSGMDRMKRKALNEEALTQESNRQKTIRLAKEVTKLKEANARWRLAKELLDRQILADAAAENAEQTGADTPKERSTNAGESATPEQQDQDIINEQWEREQGKEQHEEEQEQFRSSPEIAHSTSKEHLEREKEQARSSPQATQHTPEVPETSPTAEQPSEAEDPASLAEDELALPTAESDEDQATAGAAAPGTPEGNSTKAKRLSDMSLNTSSSSSNMSFQDLQPGSALPSMSAGGHPIRWSLDRTEAPDGRAEYALETARLEGESKSSRARRVKRERDLVEKWTRFDSGKVVEKRSRK
ncbi:hypothetical protein Q7P37_002890 [Cladosporium fusiforme]